MFPRAVRKSTPFSDEVHKRAILYTNRGFGRRSSVVTRIWIYCTGTLGYPQLLYLILLLVLGRMENNYRAVNHFVFITLSDQFFEANKGPRRFAEFCASFPLCKSRDNDSNDSQFQQSKVGFRYMFLYEYCLYLKF